MIGLIIKQRGGTKFRCDETRNHFLVVGAYDIDGNLSDIFKFQDKQEVEAIETNEGEVVIKFSPI